MNPNAKSGESLSGDKIPVKSKFAYGCAGGANVLLSQIGLATITFFYNVKLGLGAGFVAIAWLIFAAWNAFNDPLFGFLEDRTKSKMGRRIPYIRFGAPIYGLLFILCWFPFVDVSNEFALFINLLVILFAFDTIYTIIGLITYSLPAEMALTSKERANLMIYNTLLGSSGLLLAFILPVLLLTGDKNTSVSPLFYISMIIIGIVCACILFTSSYFLKENKYTQLEETLPLIQGIKETFKNKPFLIFEVSNFSFLLVQTIVTTAIFYYVAYVLMLSGFETTIPLLIVFLMIFAFAVVYSKLISKYGVKNIYIFSLAWTAMGFIVLFFVGWTYPIAILAFLLIGIGFSGYIVTNQVIIADIIDYDETRTGKRRETTYSGINALLTKPAISVANGLFLLIIMFYGFQEGAQTQTTSAQFGIMLAITIIPAIFLIISALVMFFYPLDGPEWNSKKDELKKIHEEKEEAYLQHLREQGKL